MAVVAVSANNTRVEDGEAYTGWNSIGSGPGGASEGSFFYQGTKLANRKVTSSSGAGMYYDPTGDGGSAQDMTTAAKRTWMVKAIVTDFGGLQTTNGFRIRIGSGTGAYHVYIIAGSSAKIAAIDAYPAKGGFIIIPIDPNISGYRDSTTGSPSLTAVDYFGIVAAFATASAKSENVGCDAIDLGTGLTITGGDGASTDGEWQDFVTYDEDTVNNRFGYCTTNNGVINLFGTVTIGTATATVFTDPGDEIIFFPDGLYQAGWSGIAVDLQNATTAVTISSTITSLGTTTVEDTRADYTVTGTSGTHTLGSQLNNFRNVSLTSATTVDGADIECVLLTQSNAEIKNSTIRTNQITSVACLQDPTFGAASGLHDTTFKQTGAGHAIEISTAGTYTFSNLFFSGYGANATNDAAIDVTAATGTVTLAISGGDSPTYKTAGATVVVQNAVTIRVTVKDTSGSPIQSARVRMVATETVGTVTTGDVIMEGATNASGIVEDTSFNYEGAFDPSGLDVSTTVRKATTSPLYKGQVVPGTITSTGYTVVVSLVSDE